MEKVMPRTVGQESMTQDNVVKAPAIMPKVENTEGNEMASVTAGLGAPTGKVDTGVAYRVTDYHQLNATSEPYLNIPANGLDQRSPRSKGMEMQDVPEAGRNQYQ